MDKLVTILVAIENSFEVVFVLVLQFLLIVLLFVLDLNHFNGTRLVDIVDVSF